MEQAVQQLKQQVTALVGEIQRLGLRQDEMSRGGQREALEADLEDEVVELAGEMSWQDMFKGGAATQPTSECLE